MKRRRLVGVILGLSILVIGAASASPVAAAIGFSEPVNISRSGNGPFQTVFKVSEDGTYHVAWLEFAAGQLNVFYSRSADGETFTEPVNVSNSTGFSFGHAMAVGADGRVALAWLDLTSGLPQALVSHSADGESFSDPAGVSDPTVPADFPAITFRRDGSIVVAWTQPGVFLSRFSADGVNFSSANQINAGEASEPILKADSRGTVFAAWVELSTGNGETFFSRSADGKTFSAPINLSNNSERGGGELQLQLDRRDNVHLLWIENLFPGLPGNPRLLYAQSRDNGRSFAEPVLVVEKDIFLIFGAMAVDENGGVNLGWQEGDFFQSDVFFTRAQPAGRGFAPARQVFSGSARGISLAAATDNRAGVYLSWDVFGGPGQLVRSGNKGVSFTEPVAIGGPGFAGNSMVVGEDGIASFVVSKDGDIWFLRALPFPEELIQDLVQLVTEVNGRSGIVNSLDAKLEAVVQALDDLSQGNDDAAVGALRAFIQAVESQRGIHISEADADALVAAAQGIIAALGG